MYQIHVKIFEHNGEHVAEVIRDSQCNIGDLRFVGYGLSKMDVANRALENGWIIVESSL